MLRVAEHAERTDTGRQRKANEDAYFARSPLFAVADGMGGAQAGEVASQTATEVLEHGLPDGPGSAEERLAGLVAEANARIHELGSTDRDRQGMGTTMTAAYVGEDDVAVAHVGDSRMYRLRDGELEKLTEDHTLVAELERQGKITQEEAGRHPQRSIITRALGPEGEVAVDHHTWPARPGDVYLICSDGLMMFAEEQIGDILRTESDLRTAARALVDAANAAGGRDNITVVLFRVEDVAGRAAAEEQPTGVGTAAPRTEEIRQTVQAEDERDSGAVATAVRPRAPRTPAPARAGKPPSPWRRRLTAATLILLLIVVPVIIGVSIAVRSVYFVGTDDRGFVAVYQGLPYDLPAGVHLYREQFVSSVNAAALTPPRRTSLLDHKLRSQNDANDLVKQLELGQISR
jgi:serine/threonine protein phosphatase PrpC